MLAERLAIVTMLIAGAFAPAFAQEEAGSAEHSIVTGPQTICGRTAHSARDFEAQVIADPAFRRLGDSDRYYAMIDDSGPTVWTFAKEANFAFPVAVCRRPLQQPDGSWNSSSQILCESSRANCDRVVEEFDELDRQLRAELEAGDR